MMSKDLDVTYEPLSCPDVVPIGVEGLTPVKLKPTALTFTPVPPVPPITISCVPVSGATNVNTEHTTTPPSRDMLSVIATPL